MPETRLHFIVARKAPVAVVFRRGPTRQVEVLKWNLTTDQLKAGQWLKGRIYERRCDLSPAGDLLIYFAAKYETELRTWTAISRPPYLTALALWPKGDAWGGWGTFRKWSPYQAQSPFGRDESGIGVSSCAFDEDRSAGEAPGWGEDNPIHHIRLVRDGWTWIENGSTPQMHSFVSSPWITYEPPLRYRRTVGTRKRPITLEMSIEGLKERDGSWYIQSYRLIDGEQLIRDIGRADWADAAPDGSLLLGRDGRLLRLDVDAIDESASADFREIADLRDHQFEPRTAPPEALTW